LAGLVLVLFTVVIGSIFDRNNGNRTDSRRGATALDRVAASRSSRRLRSGVQELEEEVVAHKQEHLELTELFAPQLPFTYKSSAIGTLLIGDAAVLSFEF